MIDYIKGKIIQKLEDEIILESNMLGYKILVPPCSKYDIPEVGAEIIIYIVESFSTFSGTRTLYGFVRNSDRELFEIIKTIPKINSRTILGIVGNACRSLNEFNLALINEDLIRLKSFGITEKTSEKLIANLKNKIKKTKIYLKETEYIDDKVKDAFSALIALGYKENIVQTAIKNVMEENNPARLEDIIKLSFKYLGNR